MMEKSDKITEIWKEHQKGKQYQQSIKIDKEAPRFIKFKEGDQWPEATERTKNLPRPVFNIIEMFVGQKRAAITNQNLVLNYRPTESYDREDLNSLADQGAKDYTDYTHKLWEEMNMDGLNNEMVDDAITLGTGIQHFYWDEEVFGGGSKKYKGDIRGEIIDILDITFGNPKIKDIQRQPYIIIESRASVKSIKEYAQQNGINDLRLDDITADDDESEYDTAKATNSQEENMTTLLTKYYRTKGEIVYDRAVKNLVIVEGKSLTPAPVTEETLLQEEGQPLPAESNVSPEQNRDKEGEISEENFADEEDITGADESVDKETLEDGYKISLYPLVMMTWRPRKKSCYGIGDAKDLITINKVYNFLKAMQILSMQNTGWPTTVVKDGALQGQKITNEPGQVLTDYSPEGSKGISYLDAPSFPVGASQIAEEIFNSARTISRVTEVSTGENIGGNMAASAIIALQNQASTPIKEYTNKYKRCMKAAGKIFEEFYKTYYSVSRPLMTEDEEGDRDTRMFAGTDYRNISFKQKLDVGTGSEFGEELSMKTLDMLYENKEIDGTDYVKLAPANVAPFKNQFLKIKAEKEIVPEEVLDVLRNDPEVLQGVINFIQKSQTGEEDMDSEETIREDQEEAEEPEGSETL